MLDSFIDRLRTDPFLSARLAAWRVEPAREGRFEPLPSGIKEPLGALLAARGIHRLYSHQVRALEAAEAGRPFVVATPTASGKSLCYNLPVLAAMRREDPRPTALYLFPTKALARDQVAELMTLACPEGFRTPLRADTYDGDTPSERRRIIRDRGDVVVTNPYMLHAGILPQHMRWRRFFERLRFVVIDEIHVYQGVFGSSVANVLRRLRRIAARYGSHPLFLGSSATIARPGGHFESLVEDSPVVIAESGAPRPERHHVFYDPPILNRALGLRASAVDEARRLVEMLMRLGVSTIVFGRTRSTVEVLTRYFKDLAPRCGLAEERVVGYRGGYLPDLRRRIERGLREGEIRVVAATSALELGVDIGSLDAVVMTGYPGSVASYHQQSGRAGRRSGRSISLLLGTSHPLDRYVLGHPEHVFASEGGGGAIHPDNLVIAANHMKCAAFELPFQVGEGFGRFPHAEPMLEVLSEPGGPLLEREGRFHWMAEGYPAEGVPLDAAEADSFLVILEDEKRSLGHVDRPAAITTIHENAIYQHQGVQYQITHLDWDGRRALARRVTVDHYTEAQTQTEIQVLHEDARLEDGDLLVGRGDVHVSSVATLYKKIRFYTNENLETGPIHLPPEESDTTAFWVVFGRGCGEDEDSIAGPVPGMDILRGMAWLLRGVAPLVIRMAGPDLRARAFGIHPHFDRPALFLYDNVPGGVGLAEGLHRSRRRFFRVAAETLAGCSCRSGCPGCVGVHPELGPGGKRTILDLLNRLRSMGEPGEQSAWGGRPPERCSPPAETLREEKVSHPVSAPESAHPATRSRLQASLPGSLEASEVGTRRGTMRMELCGEEE